MTGTVKHNFIKRLKKPEEVLEREEIINFINELWEDHTGAYNEGKVDGMERAIELLTGRA